MQPGRAIRSPGEVHDRRHADDDVDGNHDDRDRGGDDGESGDQIAVLPAEQQGHCQAEHRLRDDRDVRCLVHGMSSRERPGEDAAATERVDHA